MALKEQISTWWTAVPPKQKRIYIIMVVLIVIFVVPALLPERGSKTNQRPDPRQQQQKAEGVEAKMVAPSNSKPKNEAELAAEVAALKAKLGQNQQTDAQRASAVLEEAERIRTMATLQNEQQAQGMAAQLRALQDELRLMKSGIGNGPAQPLPDLPGEGGNALPGVNIDPNTYNKGAVQAPGVMAAPQPEPQKPKMRVIGKNGEETDVELASAVAAATKPANNSSVRAFLTAGSIIDGVLLNGMDAPAGSVAEKNPVPALFRVKKEAILPNRYRGEVNECFIIISGYGSLSSERAILRTERLACVLKDSRAIETKLDGYIVGSDGRTGIRGRLVSREGQLIAKTLMAGMIGGLGSAFSAYAQPTVQTGQGNNLVTVGNQALQNGLATGLNTSAQAIADFYLEMARQTIPTIEIDAGTPATIVLLKGTYLNFAEATK